MQSRDKKIRVLRAQKLHQLNHGQFGSDVRREAREHGRRKDDGGGEGDNRRVGWVSGWKEDLGRNHRAFDVGLFC